MAMPLTPIETKTFSSHELKLVRGTYGVMARLGTQQLSLRRIAKELGVSPALLVYHFGSKDNLLFETMHWALAGSVRRLQRQIAGVEDPAEALRTSIDAIFVGARANRAFYLIYLDLVQYAVRHESFTKLAVLLREHIDDSYARVIGQGVQAGVFEVQDVELAARQVRAIVEGGFVQWLQTDDWEETYDALQRDSYAAALKLLAPAPPAPRLRRTRSRAGSPSSSSRQA
ncbi:MAG: TetR/AcrR family transcriptional regulator [Solirubrobacteraceae bacterium]